MDEILKYFIGILMLVGVLAILLGVFVLISMGEYAEKHGAKAVKFFLASFWLLIVPASMVLAGGKNNTVLVWLGIFAIPLYFHINGLSEKYQKSKEKPEPSGAPVAVADDREKHQGGQSSGRPGAFDVPPQDN